MLSGNKKGIHGGISVISQILKREHKGLESY